MDEECLTVSRLPYQDTTKILIGEVSQINTTVIKKFLEKLGYNLIVQVDNGVDAVAYAT
jgi:CheY-like chemotaxis protein